MIRPAGPGDAAMLEAFLATHAATSMFLRSNLAKAGTQDRRSQHGTQFLLDLDGSRIRGVFGVTNSGYLMCQAPASPPPFWRAVASFLEGRSVQGMTGVPDQVARCLAALQLDGAVFSLRHDEPLYRLDLATLVPQHAHLRQAKQQDVALLAQWFAAYTMDTGMGGDDADALADAALARAEAALTDPDIKLMVEGGVPVAMAAFNARLSDMVQVGGVYVPAARRGQGIGRRIVGQMLCDAAAEGVQSAILFANNQPAARAYEALGFRQIGWYHVAILAAQHRIGVPA